MLDFLGEGDAAERIRRACEDHATATVSAEPVTASTTSVGDSIAALVGE